MSPQEPAEPRPALPVDPENEASHLGAGDETPLASADDRADGTETDLEAGPGSAEASSLSEDFNRAEAAAEPGERTETVNRPTEAIEAELPVTLPTTPDVVRFLGADEALVFAASGTGEGVVPKPGDSQHADLSTGRLLDALDRLGDDLRHRFDVIQTLVERELRAEANRERIVDRLHAELQDYKQDLLLKVMRPVFIDLIQLHDDIGKMIEARNALQRGTSAAAVASDSEADPASIDGQPPSAAAATLVPESESDDASDLLRSIQTGIEDILYRQGVEPFQETGEMFDPRRQRAVATVPTSEPDRTRMVAGRLRKGFTAGEKVIRPEIVSVYTHKA
jgi:molecular chaperone GrpE